MFPYGFDPDLAAAPAGFRAMVWIQRCEDAGTGGMGHEETHPTVPSLDSYQRTEMRRLIDSVPRRFR